MKLDAHARGRRTRILIREFGALGGCYDDAGVVDAGDTAKADFNIAGEAAARLRIDYCLRREHADVRERFTGRLYVRVRNPGKRKSQEQVAAPARVDDYIILAGRERDAPCSELFLNLGKLLGVQGTRKEWRAVRMAEDRRDNGKSHQQCDDGDRHDA
jgi:hypothetical protein